MHDWWRRFKAQATARAARKDALASAKWDLEMWADYGRPEDLDKAIETLRSAE